MAEKIFNEIPGFEIGSVMRINKTDEVGSLLMASELISEILYEWNTNVAFISLTGRGESLEKMIKGKSRIAKLYAVNQKNQDLQVILRKALGMVHRKFVRAVFIEGYPTDVDIPWDSLEKTAKAESISITFIGVVPASSPCWEFPPEGQ